MGLFLFLFPIIEVNSFEDDDITLYVNTEFSLYEESVKKGSLAEYESLDINLPSETWNIRDIELNFTKIDFEPEVKIIENNTLHNTYEIIYNKNPGLNLLGLSVQLEIEDPLIMYGVYIYGYNHLNHPGTPQLQLRGFDDVNKNPNVTIIRSVDLNISSIPGWYIQKFNSPVLLKPGNYSVVLDGSSIPTYTVNNAGFYWAFNAIDPIHPSLHTSKFTSVWTEGESGKPFLYKVIQKLNATIYPEEINMTAELGGEAYQVSNVNVHGKGYLKRNQINYRANNKEVRIKVKNNKTRSLRFDINYYFNIYNILNSSAIASIKYNESTIWRVLPDITRHSNNDTIIFAYPKRWENLNIFKNSLNVSSEVIFDTSNYLIIIPNNTIQKNVDWEITGNSPSIEFNINAPKLEYKTGQELTFNLGTNPLPGIYTLKLYDPSEFLEFQTVKQYPSDDGVFTYSIPTNAIEGEYTAFIFWNNGTDGGVQSITFSIIYDGLIPQDFDFSLLILIGLITIGSVAAVSTGYVTTKKIKTNKREKLNLILERCNDIMNLKYIIVLDPKTGIDLFAQSFEKKELDPTLIAGFLQAIHNFGDEVLEGVKESKTIKVEYKDSIIVMTDFINVRLITILKSNPSKNFLYSIETLAYHVYKYYGKLIESFKGNLKPYRSIIKLVESDLNVSLRYPMTIKIQKNIKLNQQEKNIVKRALDIMKENRFSHFYAIYLLPENECKPSDYESILQLIKKGVFQPIQKKFE
jgi:hypothetical protein